MHADASSKSEAFVNEPRVFLSRADVDRLLEDNSIDSRVDVADKIAQQYVNAIFSPQEMRYAEQIFRLLMRDSELRVRQTLARRLEHAGNAPRDVLLALAGDHERVAIPILRGNPALSDADLIRIVENSHAVGKIDAIAQRDGVSQRVSHALIETHYPQVIKSLLGNHTAQIAPKDFDLIIDEHRQDSQITQALADRPHLPLPVVEKLVHFVSQQVAETLRKLYKIDVEPERRQSQESMLMQLVTAKTSESEINETINQMHAFGRLTPSTLISALCKGHLLFFEIGMAKLAGIPKPNARKLIRDKGSFGFEALYEKAGMPSSLFEAVKLLLNAILTLEHNPEIEAGSKLYTGMVIDAMQSMASVQSIENLDYLIELVRRSNDSPLKS